MSQFPPEPKKPNWFKTAFYFIINSKHELSVFKLAVLRIVQTGALGFTVFDDAGDAIPGINFITIGDNAIWVGFIIYAFVRIEQKRREVYGYMEDSYNRAYG